MQQSNEEQAMKPLSQVLKVMPNTVEEQNKNSFAMQVHGSVNVAGITIIPRSNLISVEKAKRAFQWLRLLKSYRKTVRKWSEKKQIWINCSTYQLPDSMTSESVRAGLTELLRPCSPMVTKSFVVLQAFKPMYEADEDRIKIVYDGLYRDVQDMPEVAVVLACDDLRNSKSRWFPIDEILPATIEYKDLIHDCIDYFKQGKK